MPVFELNNKGNNLLWGAIIILAPIYIPYMIYSAVREGVKEWKENSKGEQQTASE